MRISFHRILCRIQYFFSDPRTNLVELLALGLVLTFLSCSNLEKVPYQPDESSWIASSYILENFMSGKISSEFWPSSWFCLVQPPMTYYIIGIGRRMGGYRSGDLNIPWEMPAPRLLWWSRLPMAILAAFCVLMLFFLAQKAVGRLAGYLAILLVILNPYFSITLLRAMGESPLLTFILLSAMAGQKALRVANWKGISKKGNFGAIFWLVIMGFCIGLAGGSKLNGLSVILSGCIIAGLTSFRTFNYGSIKKKSWNILVSCLTVLTASLLFFVLIYPFLYHDTFNRIHNMMNVRWEAMQTQTSADNGIAFFIDSFEKRLTIIPRRILEWSAAIRFPGSWLLNGILCIWGIWFLISNLKFFNARREDSDVSLVILITAFASSFPSFFSLLDWDRYFLLPITFSSLFIAIAISAGVRYILSLTLLRIDVGPNQKVP